MNQVMTPEVINLFLAPLFTELPLALDITLPNPSTLITQFVFGQQTALNSLKEKDYGKTLQLLTPKPSDWVLFSIRWRTAMFPTSVDAFWSSQMSRDRMYEKDQSDCYLVLPVSALFGTWLDAKDSDFYRSLLKHYTIPEGGFYHVPNPFHMAGIPFVKNHQALPLQVKIWIPGVYYAVDIVATKGKIGLTIADTMRYLRNAFTSQTNVNNSIMALYADLLDGEAFFTIRNIKDSPLENASVLRRCSLISSIVIDNLITDDVYEHSIEGRTLSFTVLPFKLAKMASKMEDIHFRGWEGCWKDASERWLRHKDSAKMPDDLFSPLFFMRED